MLTPPPSSSSLCARSQQDPIDWYAARLKDAFKGFGTADRVVCRILGCNDKATVRLIAAAYERK